MRRVLLGISVVTMLAIGLPPAVALGAAQADGMRLVRTRTSLLGTHRWYQQTYQGVDVVDALVAEHSYRGGGSTKDDRRKPVTDSPSVTPSVSAAQARAAAGAGSQEPTLAVLGGAPSRLVWSVTAQVPGGATRTLVDARNGSVVEVRRTEQRADGTGTVFNPNPIVTLQDPTLTDSADADLPVFAGAYRQVPLRHLDGSGFLKGDYAQVTTPAAVTAFSPASQFDFGRSAPGFSQTMAYFHVTTAQEYIQHLGFTDVNNRPQEVLPDAIADDASYFDGRIVLGTGGVDDAEDADIIWHEYGHAIQNDQVPGGLGGAVGEGFGDYWAATMSQPVNGGYDVACIAEWNSAGLDSPRPCLRRVDTNLTVADRTGEPHFDGQIWSRALWDINQRLGRDAANTLILESQFTYPAGADFDEAARATVETARRLLGGAAANVARKAFEGRGISTRLKPTIGKPSSTKAPPDLKEVARLGDAAPGGSAYVDLFEPYDLNDKSEALFAANVGSGGQAVITGAKGATTQLARSGEPAPGGGTFGFGVEPGLRVNGAGMAAFAYYLEPFTFPVGMNAGVYRSGPAGTRAVVVPGQTASPTGGVFLGAAEDTSINDAGAVAFSGIVASANGVSDGVGIGTFVAPLDGPVQRLVVPGDPAPGGGTFDYAAMPSINAAGDVAFTGHFAGTPCLANAPQDIVIGCFRDLFLRKAASGQVARLTGLGATAPGGGTFLDVLHPLAGDNGDVLFQGVVDTGVGIFLGVFLAHGGHVEVIAREGTAMPGGGRFLSGGFQPGNADLNDRGDVAFSATLDTDDNGDGLLDQGLYRWTSGKLTVVVRTGVVLPAGQVIALQPLALLGTFDPFTGAAINHARRVLWQATVVDAGGSLQTVLYTSG
jgi:hypothetical protein